MQSKACNEKVKLGRGDCEVLDKMYKNAEMGSSSIIDIMPKVEDDSLRAVLTVQLAGYDDWSRRTSEMLCCGGVEPKEENIVARAGIVLRKNTRRHSLLLR